MLQLKYLTKMKKKMKKNNKFKINHLKYNRCIIKLDEIETSYINKLIKNINIKNKKESLNEIKIALHDFLSDSDVRYYREKHIDEISDNIYSSLKKKLSEEIGRNIRSVFKKGYGNISSEDLLVRKFENLKSVETTIDTNTGKYMLIFNMSGGKTLTRLFSSEGEMNTYLNKISSS